MKKSKYSRSKLGKNLGQVLLIKNGPDGGWDQCSHLSSFTAVLFGLVLLWRSRTLFHRVRCPKMEDAIRSSHIRPETFCSYRTNWERPRRSKLAPQRLQSASEWNQVTAQTATLLLARRKSMKTRKHKSTKAQQVLQWTASSKISAPFIYSFYFYTFKFSSYEYTSIRVRRIW